MAYLPQESAIKPSNMDSAVASGDHIGEGFDLRQLLAALRTHIVAILAILITSLLVGIVVTMLQTPQYTSAATVQIDDSAAQILQNGQDVQATSNDWDTDRFLNTQLDVLRSRALARRVASRLKISDNPRFLAAMGNASETIGVSRQRQDEQAIALLRSHMQVTLPRQSRIVTIAAISADQTVSADIANAYAAEFIQANLQRKFESSDYARQFVSQQLAGAKQRLEASERGLNTYARTAGLIRTRDSGIAKEGTSDSASTSITSASLMQLNTAANEAKAARVAAEQHWRSVASGSPLSSREVLGNNTVQNLLTKRAEIEAELRDERSRHLEDHPNVLRLQAQLAAIEQQLRSVIDGVRSSIREEFVAAQASERELVRQVAQLQGETMGEQDRSVDYNILAREADTNRALYDGLLQRYKELTAAAGISSSNIALIDRAEPASGPSSPNLVVNLAYALFAGLLLSAVLVAIRLQLDDAVRVPEDIEHKLGLPMLGIIPKLGFDTPVEQLSDPKSSLSEAYNSLRGAIGFTTSNGAPQILLVTSATAGEGKSTSSYALARGFAKLGRKVLLVDVDMRRPSTHRQLQVANETGLSSVLVGQAKLGDALRHSAFEGLDYLTSGPIPPSPTELLASPRMQALLADARTHYDMIVLDSPPILGLADAPLLSSLVDGTLLVVESDHNRRGVLKGTLRRLRMANGRVIGVALTKFDTSNSSSYTYYYGNGYDYYAYEGRDAKRRGTGLFGWRRPAQSIDPEPAEA